MILEQVPLDQIVARRRAKIDALRVRCFSWEHERAAAAGSAYRLREASGESGGARSMPCPPSQSSSRPPVE